MAQYSLFAVTWCDVMTESSAVPIMQVRLPDELSFRQTQEVITELTSLAERMNLAVMFQGQTQDGTPLSALYLDIDCFISSRTYNALVRAGIRTVEQLVEITEDSQRQSFGTYVLDIRGIGSTSYCQIRDAVTKWKDLQAHGGESVDSEDETERGRTDRASDRQRKGRKGSPKIRCRNREG